VQTKTIDHTMAQEQKPHVLIFGAGIVGVTLAQALKKVPTSPYPPTQSWQTDKLKPYFFNLIFFNLERAVSPLPSSSVILVPTLEARAGA